MAGKFTSKKSWRSKLEKPGEAAVFQMTGKQLDRYGPGKMVVPTPMMIDEVIRTVGKGKLITPPMIRAIVAEKCGADVTCPLCTGIFLRISAETAEEDRAAGRARITPYWRVVSEKGEMNEKFPGGPSAQAKKLREEGHRVVMAGAKKKRLVVAEFEKSLVGGAKVAAGVV
jgi:hypothetical protein